MRLDTGAVHTAWYTRTAGTLVPSLASGEVVGLPPPCCPRFCCCSFQNTVNLLRGVACHVSRSDSSSHFWSL